jgi:adenine specific DNA methylase Mod
MWPRLKLMWEMLASRGSLWMTLDDIEIHRARIILDEIFGEENFTAEISWHARKSVQNDTDISRNNVNYILVYAKERRKSNRRLKESNIQTWFTEPGFVVQPLPVKGSR